MKLKDDKRCIIIKGREGIYGSAHIYKFYESLKPAIGQSLRFCVIAANGRRKHTHVKLLWITRRIRRISAFPINSERLDVSVFTSMLPEFGPMSRCATRATDVIF